ncbi:alpha/beta fold hydrolase [Pseudolysinimonas sp.]|uniref:alpha/beta fold hydrolase n=1 Tax=Pseudolysinimonas sp. TaxID=2680009 RepID=UPI003F7DEB49
MESSPAAPIVVSYGAADVPESWELVARALDGAHPIEVPRRVTGTDPVAQLLAVIEAQPVPPIVIGHSYGGLLARLAAGYATRPVAGLVLVDATSSRAAASPMARTVLGSAALGLRLAKPLARTPLGCVLLDRDAVRFVPRQRSLRQELGAEGYAAWCAEIRRGIADGTAAAELAAVVPTAARAAGLTPTSAPIAVVHSRSLTRRLERPAATTTRRAIHVTDTRDGFHNIHLVHPEAIADAVRVIAALTADTPAADEEPAVEPVVAEPVLTEAA